MASRQVLRLCKKIESDCGIICKPETFVANKNRALIETGSFAWEMIVDMEKTEVLKDSDWDFICGSNEYMKDLLQNNIKLECVKSIDCYTYGAEAVIYGVKQ